MAGPVGIAIGMTDTIVMVIVADTEVLVDEVDVVVKRDEDGVPVLLQAQDVRIGLRNYQGI